MQTYHERQQMVVKSNDLIQKTRQLDLTITQQKIVLYLISKIKPFDEVFKTYKVKVSEFCKVTGISYNGKNYADIKEAIQTLRDKSFWIVTDNEKETLFSWIEKARLIPGNGIIEIRLDEDLKPFLLQLKSRFTIYSLQYILKMKSKYSIRLYELIQSHYFNKTEVYTEIFTIEALKAILNAETYKRFNDFKVRVLLPAQEEINKYTDITINYEFIKNSEGGKGYEKVYIHIKPKTPTERLALDEYLNRDINQLSFFDGNGKELYFD